MKPDRREFLKTMGASMEGLSLGRVLLHSSCSSTTGLRDRPNIVYILLDDAAGCPE